MFSKHKVILGSYLAAALLAACSSQSAAAPTVAPTAAGALPGTAGVVAQGRLEPLAYVTVSFNVSGQVAEVLVQEGDVVDAGQVLARLTNSAAAQAEVVRADQDVLEAHQALDDLTENGALSLARAEAQVTAAEQAVAVARETLADLRAARADADLEEAERPTALAVTQAEVDLALVEVQLAQAEADRAALDASGVDPARVAMAEARVATAEAGLASARTNLAALELTAPQGGTVVGLALKAGEHVAAGQTALTLADFSAWVVKTDDLTELEAVNVAPGETVEIALDALPELILGGELRDLSARFEEKRGDITYTGTIVLAESDPRLRWGMTAAVTFAR